VRAVVQRVQRASVTVSGVARGRIESGLLVLLGTMQDDTDVDLAWMVRKLSTLRVFPDAEGKMNRSVVDVGGAILLVSQFTVCADIAKGTRPSFSRAMVPARAQEMLERARAALAAFAPTETGEFGAHMEVELVNDGPVTLWLDSRRGGDPGE
jgi:D-tyrosyl-tRNA(Tyr) deacylase